ncbi:methyltransferase domain-containing protein, partial [Lactarius hatsudake]
ETRYAAMLRARQGLIKKHGPSKEKIDSHPATGSYRDFFIPSFQCPHHVERIGVFGDDGKWVCGMKRIAKQEKYKCVIYSFGINGESSFESTLLKRGPGCEVWGYDYSVNSWGPTGDPEVLERAHFKPFALGGTNNHEDYDNPKYWMLDSLMDLDGHTFIDMLKIDIEGGELDGLTTFLSAHTTSAAEGDVLPVGQLQLEVHGREVHENFEYFARWWASLEAAGLRPFFEPNLVYINLVRGVRPELAEYSFINIRGNHALVNEALN